MLIFSDSQLVIINKPPGLSVHEAPGPGGSVLRELREHHGFQELTPIHRLDKDASGVMALTRSKEIASQFQSRWSEAEKTYFALCEGAPASETGTIDAQILEHQTGKPERLERAVNYFRQQNPGAPMPPLPAPKTSAVHSAGRAAQTDFRVLGRYSRSGRVWSCLELKPRQGRMHQIRVHLKYAGYPLACDALYGNRAVLRAHDIDPSAGEEVLLGRMPLHAAKLRLPGEQRVFEAPTPEDIAAVLQRLQSGGDQ
jgi:23S rRNA pseudouridine1911/1915/1917 synthase